MEEKIDFTRAMAAAFTSSSIITFNSIQMRISSQIGRNLTKQERVILSKKLSNMCSYYSSIPISGMVNADSLDNKQVIVFLLLCEFLIRD